MNVYSIESLGRASISTLAGWFGVARATVVKRLQQAGIRPDGKRGGYDVYRIRDAAPAIIGAAGRVNENGAVDPDTLSPADRKHWYHAELAKMQVQTTARELIPAAEVEAGMAAMAKRMVQFLDTMPDQLERDAGLTPAQVDAVHVSVGRMRGALYESIVADLDEPAAAAS